MADSKIRAQRAGRRGVSLIEVLVVLVILVVGILVIIRLYPSGFFSVQSVGNAAVADSLAQAELQAAQQSLGSLPEVIQPGGSNSAFPGGMDAYGRPQATAMDASYDPEFNASQEPDYSKTLNKARLIVNETFTVPTATGSSRQSVYVTKFGPIVMNTPQTAGSLPVPTPEYLSINSTNWLPIAGDFNSPTPPQDSAPVGSQQFVVDLANKRIAVPYAAYTAPKPNPATSYAQKMIVYIVGSDGVTYSQYLNIPPATPRDSNNPSAPNMADGINYLQEANTPGYYQGGWFDPTTAYGDSGVNVHATLPSGVNWVSVSLFRPFVGTTAFTQDPYEFELISPNLSSTDATKPGYNLGGIAFNPLAGGGVGYNALKAQVSYRVADWKVIHEDRDVPALPAGNTSVLRLSLKNLRRAGDEGPNNSIDPGLLSSGHSMYILDLDTGQQIAPGDPNAPGYDPTVPDYPLVDEDVNGTQANNSLVNVSYATGRVTFGSNAFGDNGKAHRVRIFYAGDLDWTVAVQKAPAYYVLDSQAQASANGGILPGHCYYDAGTNVLLFPQSDAGKTVEIGGTYVVGGQTKTYVGTIGIPSAVTTLGSLNYVSVSPSDPKLTGGIPASNPGPTQITVNSVRGLSARAIVAWQERGQWKSHSVDTILNRTP